MKPTNSDNVIDSRDILYYIKDKDNDREFYIRRLC